METPAPGAVLDTTPVYVHPPDDAASGQVGSTAWSRYFPAGIHQFFS